MTVAPVIPRRGHQSVFGDGVAALGEDDRPGRRTARVDLGLVEAMGRDDVQPERAQRGEVRLDSAGAEIAAAGIGQLERVVLMQQRPEEHDHGAGPAGSLDVDAVEVQLGRRR